MVLNHAVALDILYEWPGMMTRNEIWCSCCSQSELRKATMNLGYGTQFHDGTVGKTMYVTICILITYMVFNMVKFGTMHILLLLCVLFDGKHIFTGLKAISIRDYSTLMLVYFEMEQNGGQMQKHKLKNEVDCEAAWLHQYVRILNYNLCKRACVICVCETCDSKAMQLQLIWNNRIENLQTICKTFVVWTLY